MIGNAYYLTRPHGLKGAAKNLASVARRFDPGGRGMVRVDSWAVNPAPGGGGRSVLVFDADIVGQVCR